MAFAEPATVHRGGGVLQVDLASTESGIVPWTALILGVVTGV